MVNNATRLSRRAVRLLVAFSVATSVAAVFTGAALASSGQQVTNSGGIHCPVPVSTLGGVLLAVLLAGAVLVQQMRVRRRRQAKARLGS